MSDDVPDDGASVTPVAARPCRVRRKPAWMDDRVDQFNTSQHEHELEKADIVKNMLGCLKFKSGGMLKLAVFLLDMLLFMNIKLCNCQK